jgi:hypothetical protein
MQEQNFFDPPLKCNSPITDLPPLIYLFLNKTFNVINKENEAYIENFIFFSVLPC